MNEQNRLIQDSLIKTMNAELSSWYCSRHDCDIPGEIIDFPGRRITARVECPKCVIERETSQMMQMNVQEEKLVHVRRAAGVPERYLRASLDDFQGQLPAQQRVRTQLQEFVSRAWPESPGLLFLGNVGTGKTLLGIGLVNHWLCHHGVRSAIFCTLFDLFSRIKASWHAESYGIQELVIKRLREVPLLVIDEIGVQYGSEVEMTIFTALINHRYSALLQTVLIGNLTLEECKNLFDERVIDRFREGGHVLAFTWPSQRGARNGESPHSGGCRLVDTVCCAAMYQHAEGRIRSP